MKRVLTATLLSVVLSATLSSIPTNAAIKAGTTCTKLGQIKQSKAISFECVKSKKRLIWKKANNGNSSQYFEVKPIPSPSPTDSQVLKPQPIPSTSAEPSASPSPTPQPSHSENLIPKFPTSFNDLVENYQGISRAAWDKARTKIINSQSTPIKINLVLGPNSSLTYKTPEKAFDLTTRLYSGYAKPSTINYLVFNFEDRDWAVKKMDELMPNKGSRWIYDVACASKDRCWGGGAFSDGSDTFLIVITVGYISNNTTEGTLESHEFTHVIQQSIMKSGNPWPHFDPWPPTWYWEGQAEFTQNAAIWHDSFEMYLNRRYEVSASLFTNPKFNEEYIRNYFVINGDDQWRKMHDGWRQYDLGAMFVEILTALRGPDSTMEIWKLAQTGLGFAAAFERVYEVPFKDALPIMAKAIALQLGK